MRGAALGVLVLAAPAWAELPEYTFEIQARTNLVGNASGAFNLEPGNLLPGSFPIPITAERKVGFVLSITPEGRRALWYGGDGVGRRIYLLPSLGEDANMGELSLNSRGQAAFTVTGATDATNNGIYVLDVATPDKVRLVRAPLGSTSWSSLLLNEAGQMAARVTVGTGKVHVLYTPQDDGGFDADIVASEQGVDGSSPYTFLYSPSLNDNGQVAGVADVATAGAEWFQELRVWSASASSQLIAASRGLNPESPIYRFASVAPALNNLGQVAFLATVRNASNQNRTALLFWDGTELKRLAQDGEGDIRTLEFFPPDINDSGLVVFRAIRASDGFRAVWVSDGATLKPVVVEHDILPSDLGDARVDQEKAANPVFAGTPSINVHGDIAFGAGLAPPDNDQEEWGTAIYVAQASRPGSGGADGGVDADGGTGEPDLDGGAPDLDGGAPDLDGGVDADGGTGEPDADGGEPSVDAGEPGSDSDGADAGTGAPDAGGQPSGPGYEPPPAPGVIPPSDTDTDTGCGCSSTSPAALWPWAVAGLLGLSRRLSPRRRERSARD